MATIGFDCVGALQFSFEDEFSSSPKINAIRVSNNDIANILKNSKTQPLGINNEDNFRISLAGIQEKTAFLKIKNKWYRPQGTTPTSHIFKLPIGKIEHAGIDLQESLENEWLCLQIFKGFRLDIPNAAIEEFSGVKTLLSHVVT